jgi:hypothetical protein
LFFLIMAPPHIISWAANERSISPISTTPTSVVSIESISSDSSSTRATQSRVQSMSFPLFLGDREPGVRHATNDPFANHDKYYFKDGNITFLVWPCLIICNSAYCFYSRLIAPFTVCTAISFHSIQRTSPPGLTNLGFASTNRFPS